MLDVWIGAKWGSCIVFLFLDWKQNHVKLESTEEQEAEPCPVDLVMEDKPPHTRVSQMLVASIYTILLRENPNGSCPLSRNHIFSLLNSLSLELDVTFTWVTNLLSSLVICHLPKDFYSVLTVVH